MAKTTDEELLGGGKEEEEEITFGAEEESEPTWFDYWADIFQESIPALIGTYDGRTKDVDPHEVVIKAKEIADEFLRELQYQHNKMSGEEAPEKV